MGTRLLVTAAAASYLANCALGTAVGAKVIDTSGARWVHHAIYIATATLTAAALGVSDAKTTIALAPTAVPLAVIPYASAKSRRHPLIALTAAPFYAAALARVWRR